jgi:hypothetical protein
LRKLGGAKKTDPEVHYIQTHAVAKTIGTVVTDTILEVALVLLMLYFMQ